MPQPPLPVPPEADVAVEDILAAMRQSGDYLDVSPADVLAVYRLAYAHAAARLGRDKPVSAIMTRDVVVIEAGDTALRAARIMAGAGISGLPVLDRGIVVGILSAKDLLRLLDLPPTAKTVTLLALLLDPASAPVTGDAGLGKTPVSSLMTTPAVTVDAKTSRVAAAALMTERNINRLPVLDGTRLCGIVTRGDVARTCREIPGGCRA